MILNINLGMATKIITDKHFDDGYCLTSQLRTVAATTDLEDVTCVVYYCGESTENVEQIYWAVLFAEGGRVEIADVGAIIEQYFRSNNIVAGNIRIKFGDSWAIIFAVYCEDVMPESWDLNDHLWITSYVQRVHYDSVVTIAAIKNTELDAVVRVLGHQHSDGSLSAQDYTLQAPFGQGDLHKIDVKYYVDWALGKLSNVPREPLDDVLLISVEYNGSQVLLYLMRGTEYLTFEFANAFNEPERVDICGTVKKKTEVERNEAISGGSKLQYDRKILRSYEVETEALSEDDAKMVERLITSHSASVIIDGVKQPIIITDETCESSNDDESLTSYKFTWQFADRRLKDWNAVMPVHEGIFTQEYTEEYE